ncbi:MAG: hypothetical protein HYY84_18050 [Deltaproteobacteria bacterium]|nr:hypothetical protein [Deltaproteobacteria bacterium]
MPRVSRYAIRLAILIATVAALPVALAAERFRPESGRYRIESIDSFPDFVRGSATLQLTRAAGRDDYNGHVIGMKTFGFDFPEIPESISLSGKVFEDKWLGRTRERLGLVGMFIRDGRSCFLRLSARPIEGGTASTKEIFFAGWLDCGKKRVQLGFAAERETAFAGLVASSGR